MNDEERGAVDDLAVAAEELRAAVHDLRARITFNRRWSQILTGLMVLKAATIIVLIFVVVQLSHTQNTEDTTRHQVLCPLYSLFVQSVNQPHSPNETDAQYAARVAAKPLIMKGYHTLGCS